nr:hypothetical protein CPGR_00943 [Mycolicibacterium fortuitum subsp. fortuitum DSM 46621 = ATCC 6841 = JCM 6387]
MIGIGQRTTAVPTLRHPLADSSRLGSSRPNFDATVSTAGASVSAAAMITKIAMAHGRPMVWK